MEQNYIEVVKHFLAQGNWAIPVLFSLFMGFISSLSPCIYPLIPITLSILGTRQFSSKKQGFLVASVYVLGMTVVYCLLGIGFSLMGLLVGSLMQSKIVLFLMGGIFFFVSLSMFGILQIVLPTSVLTRLNAIKGSGFKNAFFMGLVAGVIALPCTGPVLAFVLTLIASQQNIFLGLVLMLSFSIGVGILFLLLGTFSWLINIFPRSGIWMLIVKNILGASVLGVSAYYLLLALSFSPSGLFKSYLSFLWLVFGIILIAINQKAPRVFGVFMVAWSVTSLLIGEKISEPGTLSWTLLNKNSSMAEFEQLLAEARLKNEPVLLDFYADWCAVCKRLYKETLTSSDVEHLLRQFKLVRIDFTDVSPLSKALLEKYRIVGLPTLILIDAQGEQAFGNITGFVAPKKLIPFMSGLVAEKDPSPGFVPIGATR